ncbi:acyl-CoA dehydrogenase family protein [Rhodopseudomonas palustris]|uniref:acyl-CoA dehydrogenase family protein n=1 Tax=Rhodopseudomonas palustris TaxID=1076 RepID=UPI000E5B8A45|nr:acyl-CoA dehydrogenase [Rhodopseudomonas palustris]QLH69938.1 acyl-CoA dehydrogenase [Rhodopseudomonas palustris]RIA03492.1 acyl-CoA dehydrogenase [Rhodopseudomonas palustris]
MTELRTPDAPVATQATIAAVAERIARWRTRTVDQSGGDPFAPMAQAGLFEIGLPDGDAALDSYGAIAQAEQAIAAATGELGLATAFAGRQLIARFFIAGFASAAQRSELVPRIASGRGWAAVAISEPGAGAHPKHLQTTAEQQGDGYVINGRKAWITNGPVADLFLVLAITGVEQGRKRYGLFLLPRGTAGLTLTPMPSLDVLKPASHCELSFENCVVPASARIGAMPDAYPAMALPFRDLEDTVATATTVGFLDRLLRTVAVQIERSDEHALTLGRLAGLLALAQAGSAAAVRALDSGEAPNGARVIGVRSLARILVDELRALLSPDRIDDQLTRSLAAFDVLANVAREPRKQRQIALGQSLWSNQEQ